MIVFPSSLKKATFLLKYAYQKGTCTTFLDVFIDANLFWKQHIEKVSSSISKIIGILYKSRDVLSKQSLKQLYFSFIHNYVNYANIARASTCKSKLERIYRCHIHM